MHTLQRLNWCENKNNKNMLEAKNYKTKDLNPDEQQGESVNQEIEREYFFPSEGIVVMARNTAEAEEKMLEIKNNKINKEI